MLRAKSFSVFQSMSHSLSPDAAVFIPRQIPVDGPLQVQQIPSYMTNCYPFVQLDAERYGYGIIYISIMITVNQTFICVWKFFTRCSWHKYISRCETIFKCIWCIIFFDNLRTSSLQTNFSLVNWEKKLLRFKLVYNIYSTVLKRFRLSIPVGFIMSLFTERNICCIDNDFIKVNSILIFNIHTI